MAYGKKQLKKHTQRNSQGCDLIASSICNKLRSSFAAAFLLTCSKEFANQYAFLKWLYAANRLFLLLLSD